MPVAYRVHLWSAFSGKAALRLVTFMFCRLEEKKKKRKKTVLSSIERHLKYCMNLKPFLENNVNYVA